MQSYNQASTPQCRQVSSLGYNPQEESPGKTAGMISPLARAQANTPAWQPESKFVLAVNDSPSQHADRTGLYGAERNQGHPNWHQGEVADSSDELLELGKPPSADAGAGRVLYTGGTRAREVQERPSTAEDLGLARVSSRDAVALISSTSTPVMTPSHSPLRPRTSESHLSSYPALQQHGGDGNHSISRSRQVPSSRPGTGCENIPAMRHRERKKLGG